MARGFVPATILHAGGARANAIAHHSSRKQSSPDRNVYGPLTG